MLELKARDGRARAGVLRTPHGEVETPGFMPVGTCGSVKGVTPDELRACGARIVLANTYHLLLRPGHELIRDLGGLHRFMSWSGPILTDSGGYQIFSLAEHARIDDEGVTFRSHLDGSRRRLTAETAMEVQAALGSDIPMLLDECAALPASREMVAAAVERTTRWARRGVERYAGPGRPFGIVQGGTFPELRERSARELVALDLAGYAIGGVHVGEGARLAAETVSHTAELLPPERPRYLMGVGRPEDLVQAVGAGVDLFDCVLPTRNARNGQLFTSQGTINIKRSEYRRDERALDPDCGCPTCRGYSRAYLRHLFVARELLSSRLLTLHNLTYYLALMDSMRRAILAGRFEAWRREAAPGRVAAGD